MSKRSMRKKRILVAVTGASALPLARRFLMVLEKMKLERHLVVSEHALCVQEKEEIETIDWNHLCEKRYADDDISSSVCSGSFPVDAMTIIPCSMNTLAHIAHGIENSVITRAAAVNLKQERKVILVPRESPLSLLHIENLRQAKLAGCSIVLPIIAFYFQPQTIDDILDHIAGKVLELLDFPHELYRSWE